MPIGRPVDRRVMDDDEFSVARCTYVKFDGPIAAGKRAAKNPTAAAAKFVTIEVCVY